MIFDFTCKNAIFSIDVRLYNAFKHLPPPFLLVIRFQARQIAPGNLQAGQVVFVDLAGSERVGKSGVSADGTGGARAFSVLDDKQGIYCI